MKAQQLYDFREKFEVFSGEELHDFFRDQIGDPSPSGSVKISGRAASRFVMSHISAMAHNSPSLSDHCDQAVAAWHEIS